MYMYIGFGFISGLQTQGYHACPICGPGMKDIARRSNAFGKTIYMGHTHFLPLDHELRSDLQMIKDYDDHGLDHRPIPERTPYTYWRSLQQEVEDPNHRRRSLDNTGLVRWGILNTLPYWGRLKIHHLLDVMHIEGNVGRSLIRHLYGEKGVKNFREGCKEASRHPDLWPKPADVEDHEWVYKPAPWLLTGPERRVFRDRIGQMQFPTGEVQLVNYSLFITFLTMFHS